MERAHFQRAAGQGREQSLPQSDPRQAEHDGGPRISQRQHGPRRRPCCRPRPVEHLLRILGGQLEKTLQSGDRAGIGGTRESPGTKSEGRAQRIQEPSGDCSQASNVAGTSEAADINTKLRPVG